jgi:uncharacterized protein
MPNFTQHKPGTFSWIELATTNADAAKKFYSGLFGWTFDDNPMGPEMVYSMAKMGDKQVGALYNMGKEMAGVPSHWSSYVEVADVDAMVKKVEGNGGKIVQAPMDVMDHGRMAVCQDPAGAAICFWQSKQHKGVQMKGEVGSLCWSELYTTNVDAAGKFYVSTLGWKTDAMDMGPAGTYTMFKVPGEENSLGGMMAMPPTMKGVPSNWLPYIQVASCDASTKKANDLGAKVMVPATDIPNVGRFSILQDPTGATIALYEHQHGDKK